MTYYTTCHSMKLTSLMMTMSKHLGLIGKCLKRYANTLMFHWYAIRVHIGLLTICMQQQLEMLCSGSLTLTITYIVFLCLNL
ncbi:MAG: hypothetical protein J6T10_15395 [Methanobrevibacter sp.]|nr:hypothetical protein [Methanobrevibacter sp.]